MSVIFKTSNNTVGVSSFLLPLDSERYRYKRQRHIYIDVYRDIHTVSIMGGFNYKEIDLENFVFTETEGHGDTFFFF